MLAVLCIILNRRICIILLVGSVPLHPLLIVPHGSRLRCSARHSLLDLGGVRQIHLDRPTPDRIQMHVINRIQCIVCAGKCDKAESFIASPRRRRGERHRDRDNVAKGGKVAG